MVVVVTITEQGDNPILPLVICFWKFEISQATRNGPSPQEIPIAVSRRLGKNCFLREAWETGGMLQRIGGIRWQGKPDLDGFHQKHLPWSIFKLIYTTWKVHGATPMYWFIMAPY